MRTPFVAGNWKMNMTIADSRQFMAELIPQLDSIKGVEIGVCPPFTSLMAIAALLQGSNISLGAQNMHWETKGAFTGEIAPDMLSEVCQYVILGHSERRAYFGETDQTVNLKVKAAVSHNLKPIVCVGETLEENRADATEEVVERQLRDGLSGVEFDNNNVPLVIAYEPVWAIGTGLAATPKIAVEVIRDVIRPSLADLFGEHFAQETRVQYGGSVKGNNAADFFNEDEIDGALVGGASLDREDFTEIVRSAVS